MLHCIFIDITAYLKQSISKPKWINKLNIFMFKYNFSQQDKSKKKIERTAKGIPGVNAVFTV